MGFIFAVMGKGTNDLGCLLFCLRLSVEHYIRELLLDKSVGQINRIFASTKERRLIFADDRLPNWDFTGVLFHLSTGLFEFLENPVCRNAKKLWINTSKIGMLTHPYLFARACDHCTG